MLYLIFVYNEVTLELNWTLDERRAPSPSLGALKKKLSAMNINEYVVLSSSTPMNSAI